MAAILTKERPTVKVFELSTRLQAVNRSDGRSATAAAAYRAACAIDCEREGRRHDYTRKAGVEAAFLVLPPAANDWTGDRGKLWNAAEFAEKNGKRAKREWKENARVAREIFFSIPHELSREGRQHVAHKIACHLAETHGVAADVALHLPGREGDERNHHCHLLFTTRRMTAAGLGEKAREWDDRKTGPKLTKNLRAFIAKTLNDALKAEGKAHLVKVEHRSFKDRGISQTPTRHQGPNRTHQLRKKQRDERRTWLAAFTARMSERHTAEIKAIQIKAEFERAQNAGKFARTEAKAIAKVGEWLKEAKAADAAPTGLKRLFLRTTGRELRDTFDRAERHARLEKEAGARIAAIRRETAAGTRAADHARQAVMTAAQSRHAAERGGIRDQIKQRIKLDLAAERTARLDQVRQQRQNEGGRTLSM